MVAVSGEGKPHNNFKKGEFKMSKENKKIIKEGNASSMTWGIKNPGKVANQAPPGAGKGKIGSNLPMKVSNKGSK